jgi:hypothetical protein
MTSQDPEATGSYLLCAFMRYGCTWSARWLPGGESKAQQTRQEHERTCVYRFHQTRP